MLAPHPYEDITDVEANEAGPRTLECFCLSNAVDVALILTGYFVAFSAPREFENKSQTKLSMITTMEENSIA